MSSKIISVVVRALNEEKWLDQALSACKTQILPDGTELELVLVDSGSTDRTLEIARKHACQIFHIEKSEFTFGRSLNIGCEGASGEILVFISAHCIPENDTWLQNLITPLLTEQSDYVYGRQVGLYGVSRFSEHQVFSHYFGDMNKIDQNGFFCNNANSAVRRKVWEKHKFDETVTGLEDMVLGKAVKSEGGKIDYVADSSVLHIHEETLQQVHRRYYREALTMREIMPEVHFNLFDMARCMVSGVVSDFRVAIAKKVFWRESRGVLSFRFMQFWGTYRGHNEHRTLSRAQKEAYYYPRVKQPQSPKPQSIPQFQQTSSLGRGADASR